MEELKVDQIKSVLNCAYCDKVYKDPLWLPCHETVCKEDVNRMKNSDGELECPFCKCVHEEPEEGFPVDKKISRLVDLQINKIDFGAAFNKGKSLLITLNTELTKLENLKQNPNVFVDNHFDELSELIEQRKSFLVGLVDECTAKLLDETTKYRNECKEVISSRSEPTSEEADFEREINDTRAKLNDWFGEFDQLALNEQKRDQILQDLDMIIPKIKIKLVDYQNKLLKNNVVKLDTSDEESTRNQIRAAFGSLKLEQVNVKEKAKKPDETTTVLAPSLKAKKHKIGETEKKNPFKRRKVDVKKKVVIKIDKPSLAKPITKPNETKQPKAKPTTSLSKNLTEEQIRDAVVDIMNSDELKEKSKNLSKSAKRAISSQVETKFPEYHFGKEQNEIVSKILQELEQKDNEKIDSKKRAKREDVLNEIVPMSEHNGQEANAISEDEEASVQEIEK